MRREQGHIQVPVNDEETADRQNFRFPPNYNTDREFLFTKVVLFFVLLVAVFALLRRHHAATTQQVYSQQVYSQQEQSHQECPPCPVQQYQQEQQPQEQQGCPVCVQQQCPTCEQQPQEPQPQIKATSCAPCPPCDDNNNDDESATASWRQQCTTTAQLNSVTGKVVVVTNAGSLLGSSVVKKASQLGLTVLAVDDYTKTVEANLLRLKGVSPIPGNIREPNFVTTLFKAYKPHVIFHIPAEEEGGLSNNNPTFTFEEITISSSLLVTQAINNHVEKFVFVSSVAADSSVSMRAIAGHAVEKMLSAAKTNHNLDYVIAHTHPTYGPGQHVHPRSTNLISRLLAAGLSQNNDQAIIASGSLSRSIPVAFAPDVANTIVNSAFLESAAGEVLVVGGHRSMTVQEIVAGVEQATGGTVGVDERPDTSALWQESGVGAVRQEKVDCLFGQSGTTTLEDGLRQTVDWAKPVEFLDLDFTGIEISDKVPTPWSDRSLPVHAIAERKGDIHVFEKHLKRTNQFSKAAFTIPQEIIKTKRDYVNQALAEKRSKAKWRQAGDGKKTRPETLVVMTTAVSLWHKAELMLFSLANTNDDYDLSLIDDHSETIDIEANAKDYGVHVISWGGKDKKPKGLTRIWNEAWHYFLDHDEYKYFILCNNDLIVPDGTIDKITNALRRGYGWVNAVTQKGGSKYQYHVLDHTFDGKAVEFATGPLRVGDTAAVLNDQQAASLPTIIDAGGKNMNGYMMGFHKEIMSKHQMDPKGRNLFDPKRVNTGNEDGLFNKQVKGQVPYGVTAEAFTFHYKGSTLRGMKGGRNAIGENNFKGDSKKTPDHRKP